MGRVFQVVSPDTGTTSYGYDLAGNLTGKTDAKGTTTSYQKKTKGTLTLSGKDQGDVDAFSALCFPSFFQGNLLTKTESSGTPLARTTSYTYNAGSQVTSVTVKSVVDPNQSKVTAFEYDAKGNMVKRTETGLLGDGTPYSYVTAYAYTPNGQIASIDGPRTDAME